MPSLGELATLLELELRGDAARPIQRLAALDVATADDLSFVSEKKHLSKTDRYSGGGSDPAPRMDRPLVGLRFAERYALRCFCAGNPDL